LPVIKQSFYKKSLHETMQVVSSGKKDQKPLLSLGAVSGIMLS
jgi:hypothetical protein